DLIGLVCRHQIPLPVPTHPALDGDADIPPVAGQAHAIPGPAQLPLPPARDPHPRLAAALREAEDAPRDRLTGLFRQDPLALPHKPPHAFLIGSITVSS